MDSWNQIIAEQYVKHVSLWKFLVGETLAILSVLAFGWALVAAAMNLDLLAPFLMRLS